MAVIFIAGGEGCRRPVTPWRSSRAALVRLAALVLTAALAAACSATDSHDLSAVGEQAQAPIGPLPGARRTLDRRIADGEYALATGVPVDSARLAHLRMTRAAVEMMDAGEDERAMDLLERAISVDGRTGFAYLYLGYLHLRQGRVQQAEVFLDRAAALLPSDPGLDAEVEALRAGVTARLHGVRAVRDRE